MKCEICGSQYRKIDTFLVCANGHTIQNTTFVATDTLLPAARSKNVRNRKKAKKYYKSSGCNMLKLILVKLLMDEAKVFFKLKNDDIFKFYTGFFDFRFGKLVSSLTISKCTIFGLIYLSKRSELESNNKPYFFEDHVEAFRKFDLHNRLLLIKNKFPSLEPPVSEIIAGGVTCLCLYSLKGFIDKISNIYTATRPFRSWMGIENDVFEETVDVSKHNLRSCIKNDFKTITPYFLHVCEIFGIKPTDDLMFYFEKYVYVFNPYTIMVPEYDLTVFIATYFINIGDFEDTQLEMKILDYLSYSKNYLISTVKKVTIAMKSGISPEKRYSLFKVKNRYRFYRLRGAIEFVNAFKRFILQEDDYRLD